MSDIHKTALIDPKVEIAENVKIGPYSIIGPDVTIDSGTVIGPHVHIEKRTRLGKNCHIATGAVLGTNPQDLKFRNEKTFLEIGNGCTIREYCTINVSTSPEVPTRIGDNCMMMAYSHVAHDCQLEEGVIMANCGSLAGHIYIERGAILGGLAAVHQFTRIGRYAFIGGLSRVVMDILPFTKVAGEPCRMHGLNSIGLSRKGFSKDRIGQLRKAYRIIFKKNLRLDQAMENLKSELGDSEDVQHLLDFIGKSQRGLTR